MQSVEVLRVLDALREADVATWLAGGWGVDALVSSQTREHRDLDILIEYDALERCLTALKALGYAIETDWLPVRIEVGSESGWVDVHPMVLREDGTGVQAGPDGTSYEYPPQAFTRGVIAGREVTCLNRDFQIKFHEGYEPRPQDLHDLELLRELGDG